MDNEKTSDRLGTRLLGWVFLLLCGALIVFLGYFLFAVIIPMCRANPILTQLTTDYQEQLQGGRTDAQDKLVVSLVVILEYANADIRAAGAQIAVALMAGLFLVTVGVLLLAAGITAPLRIGGQRGPLQFNLATAAPGVICILLGAVILGLGVTKETARPLSAQVEQALGVTYSEGRKKPPIATEGEPPLEATQPPHGQPKDESSDSFPEKKTP